jgi:hypothetical protein
MVYIRHENEISSRETRLTFQIIHEERRDEISMNTRREL